MAALSLPMASNGFHPILQKYIKKHEGDKWQLSHPIRKRPLTYLDSDIEAACALSRAFPSICTVSASNVFSVFSTHSGEKIDPKFADEFPKKKLKGVAFFAARINEVAKGKGFAAYCFVNHTQFQSLHEFVIEYTPKKELYIYQSYLDHYTLEDCFKKLKPRKLEEFIKQITVITGERSKERDKAYEKLFDASIDPLFCWYTLSFSFVPLEYDPKDVPTV